MDYSEKLKDPRPDEGLVHISKIIKKVLEKIEFVDDEEYDKNNPCAGDRNLL